MPKLILLALIIFFTYLLPQHLVGQETVLVGQVLNRADKTPIPHVNVYFKNTKIGVETNDEGYFILRNTGSETTVVFSALGFKTSSLKLKAGTSAGIQMELVEHSTLLLDVFVVPGANPALKLMKQFQAKKKDNDLCSLPSFESNCTQDEMIALAKKTSNAKNKYILQELLKNQLSTSDSSIMTPIYEAKTSYQVLHKKWTLSTRESTTSSAIMEKYLEKLLGDPSPKFNFYENSIELLGIKFISPLAENGSIYYKYFLADSSVKMNKKIYEIHFRSRNFKNLAFNGTCWIDSASSSLTGIKATMPSNVNLNFIRNLSISQQFENRNQNQWIPLSTDFVFYMNHLALPNQETTSPGIWIQRKAQFEYSANAEQSSLELPTERGRNTANPITYKDTPETPMMRTAKWVADALITGYMQVGKIDVGKIPQILRINSLEGLRLNMPLRTNEHLWEKISLGGYIGYGFKNKAIQYSTQGQFLLPTPKRSILTTSYTQDLRRIDYDYNAYSVRENPLQQGDEDFASSIFRIGQMNKLSLRKEISVGIMNDWSADFETQIILRANTLYANTAMPMHSPNLGDLAQFGYQSATLVTRLSNEEKIYDDHLQRIYITNQKAVFYGIAEIGNYQLGSSSNVFGKLKASAKQQLRFDFGQWNYWIQMAYIVGKVPYPLLLIPNGNESSLYGFHHYNLMNTLQYVADKELQVHSELILNGIILNQIPIIKMLNLREFMSLHTYIGSIDPKHQSLMNLPIGAKEMSQPYAEIGIGFTNIFRLFALQSIWRISGDNIPNTRKWGILASVKISL